MIKPKSTILFLINTLGRGGAEGVFLAEVQGLRKRGYDVKLAVLRDKEAVGTAINLNFGGIWSWASYKGFRAFLREQNIDTIYATLDEAMTMVRIGTFGMKNIRVMVRESGMPTRKSWKIRLLDLLLNIRSNRIVAVSNTVADALKRQQPLYAHKVVVVENGVEVPTEVHRNVATKVVVLTIGRLIPEKNQRLLLDGFAYAAKQAPHLYLRLVGSGPLQPELLRRSEGLGIATHVIFAGSLDRDAVKKEYEQADVFALTSDGEGFPNVLLEAMAHGLPVVSTKVGGAVEVLEEGISGFLVDRTPELLGRRLLQLAEDAGLRERVGKAARERVRSTFSFERHLDRLEKVLGLSRSSSRSALQ